MTSSDADIPDELELPIDGTLDLHLFSPKDLGTLIPDYLELCREKNILLVRIIHGRVSGALRKTVHSLLSRCDFAVSWHLATGDSSGAGATVVTLLPKL